MTTIPFDLEQARLDIADLRGSLDRLFEAHTKSDGGVIPNTPAAATDLTGYASTGHEKYISGADGGTYNMGRASGFVTSNQLINSTSAAAITGLAGFAITSAVPAYRVDGMILMQNVTSGQAQNVGIFGGVGWSSGSRLVFNWQEYSSGQTQGTTIVQSGNWGHTTSAATVIVSPAFATTIQAALFISGIVIPSGTGSFGFTAWEGAASQNWNVLAGSYVDVMPCT